ncbi:hypothetical protein [Paraglaciecola sp. MB-3u-78]
MSIVIFILALPISTLFNPASYHIEIERYRSKISVLKPELAKCF